MDVDESDDDGVIFKGSQLYSSLLNTGSLASELNEECLEKQLQSVDRESHEECRSQAVVETRTAASQKNACSLSRWMLVVKERCLVWLGFDEPRQVLRKCQRKILPILMNSSLLEADDADFLEAYITCTNQSLPSRSSHHSNIFLGIIVPCLAAYGYMRWSTVSHQWPYLLIFDCLALTSLVCTCIRGGNSYRASEAERHVQHNVGLMNKFLQIGESCIQVWKKSLRLVQEMELVARGFTLVSQKNPLSRLEERSSGQSMIQRQCPALRKLIFIMARETIHYYRNQTKHLFTLYPVSSMMDVENMFLAFESLHSYGPCLQEGSSLDEDKLYDLTDGFSVSSLKAICQLVNLHQSEFIKALTLLYHHGDHVSEDCHMMSMVKEVTAHLEDENQTLQQGYDFHRCIITSNREPVPSRHQKPTMIQDVFVAVHSLDLHLQAALNRVRSLSSWIESQESSEEPVNLSHDQITEMMQPIRAELESCKGCWEEGLNRMEKTMKKSDETDTKTVKPHLEPTSKAGTDKNKPKNIEEYIIEDQVFEAYTDPSDRQAEMSDWGIGLTKEERERKKREKQEALRMLSELKSVISVRAVETERREQVALMRNLPEGKRKGQQKLTEECHRGDTQEPTESIHRVDNQEPSKEINRGQVQDLPGSTLNYNRLADSKYDQAHMQDINDQESHRKETCKLLVTYNLGGEIIRETIDYGNNGDARVKSCKNSNGGEYDKSCQETIGRIFSASTVSEELSIAASVNAATEPVENLFDTDKTAQPFENIDDNASALDNVINDALSAPSSVVTNVGVRRLRKSHMLDDFDSDSDQEPVEVEEAVGIRGDVEGESENAARGLYSSSVMTNVGIKRLCKSHVLGDDFDSDSDMEPIKTEQVVDLKQDVEDASSCAKTDTAKIGMSEVFQVASQFTADIGKNSDEDVEDVYPEMKERAATLEERLSRVVGVNLDLSSSIAARAVAKSREFGGLTEDTFGGEVFGELSNSDSDDADDRDRESDTN